MILASQAQTRMQHLGGQLLKDKSRAGNLIYWLPRARQFALVRSVGPDVVELTYHATCPCGGRR